MGCSPLDTSAYSGFDPVSIGLCLDRVGWSKFTPSVLNRRLTFLIVGFPIKKYYIKPN